MMTETITQCGIVAKQVIRGFFFTLFPIIWSYYNNACVCDMQIKYTANTRSQTVFPSLVGCDLYMLGDEMRGTIGYGSGGYVP
jgi:hypothetical protein